jgi:hypothetical protein
MAEIFNPQTFEFFERLNTSGGSDWTAGGGTGEFQRTVSGYDANSLFYAGSKKLTSGTAGSLAAGEFNLTGTTLTVRLPEDSFENIAADADPDAVISGHVRGFNQEQKDVISAVAASTEIDVTQITIINEDNDNNAEVKLYRVESSGDRKAISSKLYITSGDTVYMGAVGLKTGEKLAVISTGAITIDISITTRSTT